MGTPPTPSNIKAYYQSGGNPQDDATALGGAPDFGAPITPSANSLIYSPTILGSLNQYRGVQAFRQEATGQLQNARVTNRCGGKIPPASGIFTVVSSSAADVGVLWVAYYLSGVWVTEELTLAGKSVVTGSDAWDADHWIAVLKNLTAPTGNLLLQVNGYTVGTIFGTADNPEPSNNIATWLCCSLYDVALATAINTAIDADNRKTDPVSGISAWSKATRWLGSDQSLSVPGGVLIHNDWIGAIARLNLPAGTPKPPGNALRCYLELIGDPHT